jgi:hypothetical protein
MQKRRIDREIPRENQGWWADVCPGKTLVVRDATEADIARCIIREGRSRNPNDYVCEDFDGGCLIPHEAIVRLKPLPTGAPRE